MELSELKSIIDTFDQSTLSELNISCSEYTIGMKRLGPTLPSEAKDPGSDAHNPAAKSSSTIQKGNTATTEMITSPIVGTFYQTPAPDAPPYVEEGDVVEQGTVICTIEAMKMMNQLETDFPCEIVRVLAPQATLVEFGQPLFEVKRR